MFVLLSTLVHCLAQLERLWVILVFDAVMMMSVLEHCVFKGLAWLLPWTPKPWCSTFVSERWPESHVYMLAHTHAYTQSYFSRSSHLVLSCLLLVFSFSQAGVLYAHISAIRPTRACKERCDHAHVSYAHIGGIACVYAHIFLIMFVCICTHRRDHAHTCMHT